VVASLDLFPPNHGELRFVNAGAGAALAVDITFAAEGGEQRRWAEPVVLSGDGQNFHLLSQGDQETNPDAKGLDFIIEAFPTLSIDGHYEDVRGETYVLQQTLDIRAQWSEAKGSRRLAAFRGPFLPFYELLRSIKDSMQKISERG
jgi:hypothetical protein